MKKKIILGAVTVIAVTVITFLAKSQTGFLPDPLGGPSPDETLATNQFDLVPAGAALSTNTLILSESDFLQKFGGPNSTATEYSEEDEKNMTHYSYSGADVWYMDNTLIGIRLLSANYSFRLSNGMTISVGDHINNVINLFPNAWANKPTAEQVFVGIKDDTGIEADMNLIFEYDPYSNLITKITVQ